MSHTRIFLRAYNVRLAIRPNALSHRQKRGRTPMNHNPSYLKFVSRHSLFTGLVLAGFLFMTGSIASAQNEKRTVFTEDNFHWQGNLKPGQTLEIINRTGEIEASGA